MKKIGILGSGIVGRTLAEGFSRYDYKVMIGSRDPFKLSEFTESNGNKIVAGSYSEAASFGDIIVLAVKGSAALEVLKMAGTKNMKGKTVIDATNPISSDQGKDGVLKFFTGNGSSLMEQLQEAVPDAKFVKAFNSVGAPLMVNPSFNGSAPTMFICGDSKESKEQVSSILIKFGWEPEDMGSSASAGAIEALCILWCIPGFLKNQWSHAFKLLKK